MAGAANLKAAANNMHRAAGDVQADIAQLRNSIGEHERNLNQEVSQIQDQMRRNEADLNDNRKSDQERALIRTRVQDMQKEISERKRAYDEIRGQLERQISDLQANVRLIENQAREVEREASVLS